MTTIERLAIIKRVVLFLLVNLAVLIQISLIVNLSGLQPHLTAEGITHQKMLGFCALFGLGGALLSTQVSRWTAKRTLGIRLVNPSRPQEPFEAALIEQIRALCTRAGLAALPEIGIYPSDEVDAFTTGPSRDRALLAVSTSLLRRMDGKAVEGVLGHEVSHIVNGDMVTMTLLQGVVNTFVVIPAWIITYPIEQFLRRIDEATEGGASAHGFVAMVLDVMLLMLAMPIVLFFSRRREFIADANSARLTSRDAILTALLDIELFGRFSINSRPSLSMLRMGGRAHGLVALFYPSHPSIPARIRALNAAGAWVEGI